MEGDKSSSSFHTSETAQEKGLSYVLKCDKISSSNRPSLYPDIAHVPIIDLAGLGKDPASRSTVVNDIRNTCRSNGFFHIINHGIDQSTLDGALSLASKFFKLPREEKMKLMSNDVKKPVRYGTSIKDGEDNAQFWRVFLKLYAHPLKNWVELWPNNPTDYREKLGKYAVEVRKLAMEIMEAITESLGLGTKYISNKMEDGIQALAVNGYPPCPNPELALGIPPHSDYSCITIVLQSSPGLEVMDPRDGSWRLVPEAKGILQVHVGDQVEVLSNGLYKGVFHRATLNSERFRISIASLHGLAMDEKIESAKELVDEEHPKGYKGSSFTDFLNFISGNDIGDGKHFMNTLKIN
ncbi:flavanone 3-dioxygenase 3 [Cornus florida]|uniref:flavanone 3-dioxygenase 3 n=1 Tax=Cornus florida TaxID=4283 RepID=UPI0028994676|nr:flavanone 3-dioxygenase 3 [Cornus florida]